MNRALLFILTALTSLVFSCNKDDEPQVNKLPGPVLETASVGTVELDSVDVTNNLNVPVDKAIVVSFSSEIDIATVPGAVSLSRGETEIPLTFTFLNNNTAFSAAHAGLEHQQEYELRISKALKGADGGAFRGVVYSFSTENGSFTLEAIQIDDQDLLVNGRVQDVSTDFEIRATFSEPLDANTDFSELISLRGGTSAAALQFTLEDDNQTLVISAAAPLVHLTKYTLSISDELTSSQGFMFDGFENAFYTQLDPANKFPEIGDEALLTLVQAQTFKYFWDFAHPTSGLARERNTSGDVVTIGGSGFGVMTIPVAIERGFISRQQGVDRLETIVNFLQQADRFHGVWPHWMNGNTGDVVPFSEQDNGGDLVETSFMIQGLLTVRQYLNPANAQEAAIIQTINQLWREVEWDWYTKGGENVLYWHWSPNYEWAMNHQIRGYNEALITYVLAAASPTHPIAPEVYHEGWARNGGIINGKEFYGLTLPVGYDYGGPLFFAHYSFLGLDPRNLEDQYANYWEQNVQHTLINRAYSLDNPKDFVGYGEHSWGLTASDDPFGYLAHEPGANDNGTLSPTAAISSIPYTPEYSMEAIRHFYYLLGDKLWGAYGFYDAFNFTEAWVADSFLAIDQGPIIIMIENHRTALLWELFMSNPEVQQTLPALGFTSFNSP